MQKLSVKLQDHMWCVVIVFSVLLLAVITFWLGGKGNEIVSYVGFAAAICSIVLAVIAIIFSILYSIRSQENVGEMRRLVDEGYALIRQTGQDISSKAERLEESAKVIEQMGKSAPSEKTKKVGIPSDIYQHLIPTCSNGGLVVFYIVAKCNEKKKRVSLQTLATRFPVNKVTESYFLGFCTAAMGMLVDLLEPGTIVENGGYRVEKLPKDFQELVFKTIALRRPESEFLQEYLLIVDKYFEAC